ncbi:MAG TPA: NINE protein [Pirellulaceae bacterium]|nr:NINE protein [Pirellulaceae bacterium]
MPIDVYCEPCQKKLRVPDTAAGKRIKCPKCQGVISVPALESSSPAPVAPASIPTPSKVASKSSGNIQIPTPTAKTSTPGSKVGSKASKPVEMWHVQTEEGEQYGPVSRQDLDGWFAEGRVTADTQLLLDGGAQWQWASDIYPELAAASAPAESEGVFPSFGEAAGSAPAGGSSGGFNFGDASSTPATTSTSTTARGKKGKGKGKAADSGEVGDKSKMVAALLGIFLGAWGVHNFYLGFTQKAIIQIVVTICTCFTGGIWGFVEGIMILTGSINRDSDGNRLKD